MGTTLHKGGLTMPKHIHLPSEIPSPAALGNLAASARATAQNALRQGERRLRPRPVQARLERQIAQLENELNALYRDLGEESYRQRTGQQLSPGTSPHIQVEDLCLLISEVQKKLERLRLQLYWSQKGPLCPRCHKPCPPAAGYCPFCHEPLPDDGGENR